MAPTVHVCLFRLSVNACVALPSCAKQDESDSSDDDVETTGGSRRFFVKKRRSVSTDVSSSAERHYPEGPLRRMSNAMSRRPRASSIQSVSTATAEEVFAEGLAPPGLEPATKRGVGGGVGMENGGTAGEMVPSALAVGGEEAAKETKAKAMEEGPPPFTMALAVTLTGLRLFLVDQVTFWVPGKMI